MKTVKTSGGLQLLMLLYKGLLLRRRHFIVTGLEILIPIISCSMILAVFQAAQPRNYSHMEEESWNEHVSQNKQNGTFYTPFDPFSLKDVYVENVQFIYCPNFDTTGNLIDEAISLWTNKTQFSKSYSKKAMTTEEELVAYVLQTDKLSSTEIIGTVLNGFNADKLPDALDYKIRYASRYDKFSTDKKYRINGPQTSNDYTSTYFLSWQAAVESSFIQKILSSKNNESSNKIPQVMMQRFPYPDQRGAEASNTFITQIPWALSIGFLIFSLNLVRTVTEEKSNGSKELMKMMGMTDLVYWLGTFLNYFIVGSIITLIICILYKVPINSVKMLPGTDFFLLFILLLLLMANTILFALTITTFIPHRIFSGIFLVVVTVTSDVLLIVFVFLPGENGLTYFLMTQAQKHSLCLFPSGVAFTIFSLISTYEAEGEGALWSNIAEYSTFQGINLSSVMGMMVASCLMYIVIIWYFDSVWPWQYGVTKPFYFPFTKSYWCSNDYRSLSEEESPSNSQNSDSDFFEEEPIGTTPGVVIKNLSKSFKTGFRDQFAVKDVSLNVYNGQITALLGHNGAGKTTTINILTGLFSPTSGTATVSGWDISSQTTNARRSLGVCPQHNILYNTLTPHEHLKFYAGLKGIKCKDLYSESSQMLAKLNLLDKMNELVKNLSGGMKRKLSLGIALIGGSEVLFLDEPTSGMDPEARRGVWDALLDMRNGRTIILTTHYMEEADILGDRIAIMAEGQIQCCGSSIFLKKKLGTGYKLHVVKEEGFDLNGLTEELHTFIPEATVEKDDEKEVTFNLLCGSDTSLGDMFEQMESHKSHLGIGSYGISVTTMEDVFLNASQIAERKHNNENTNNSANEISEQDVYTEQEKLTKSCKLALHQLWALLLKRFHSSKRSWVFLLIQVALPFLLMLLLMFSSKEQLDSVINIVPSLSMNLLSVYGATDGFYHSSEDPEAKSFANDYFKTILEKNQVNFPEDKPDFNPQEYILRYGSRNLANYLKKLMIGGTVEKYDEALNLTAWYNGEPYHNLPIALNAMHNAILLASSGTQQGKSSISLTNAPLPYETKSDIYDTSYSVRTSQTFASFMVPLALSFLSASYIMYPVEERLSKSKLLQLMTGLPVWLYWYAMFLWDGLFHLLICILLLIPFAFFGQASIFFSHSEIMGSILLLLLLYGWCSILFCYVMSFVFKRPNRGYLFILIINIITGVILSPVMFGITAETTEDNLDYRLKICLWVFRIFPLFSVSNGITNIFGIAFSNAMCTKISKTTYEKLCNSSSHDYFSRSMQKCCNATDGLSVLSWDLDKCGRDVLYMSVEVIWFLMLLLFLETTTSKKFWRWLKTKIKATIRRIRPVAIELLIQDPAAKDSEVCLEEQRVEDLWSRGSFEEESLLVHNLNKVYKNLYAVDHLTFGVHKKECFGLLGVNGAGKTTTFKMITGDIFPTEGNAYIQQTSLIHNRKEFQSFIGYCPQYDALLSKMTAVEMLTLFARLRGLTGKNLENSVNQLIRMADLQKHANKLTKHFSGGNKRKLSLALALIGTPPLILLDEPTSGVDPGSRRKIWKILIQARSNVGAAIILTTHSMEESEALCNRLAIMVNGKFRCLGSLQQLKTKYGTGYTIIIKLKKEELQQDEAMRAQKTCFNNNFPSAVLTDDHQGMLQYHIRDTSIPLSQLFKFMDDMKNRFNLADYLISGTSLEQIFLAFARAQRKSDHVYI